MSVNAPGEPDEKEIKEATAKIEMLETRYTKERGNISLISNLSDLYILTGKKQKAQTTLLEGMNFFERNVGNILEGMIMVDVSIKLWQSDKYCKKDSLRINISQDRSFFLTRIRDSLTILAKLKDPSFYEVISFKLAFVKESIGSFQDSLSILSDLISAQASNGVDLTLIIFRAAILLKHMGSFPQAIEYLDFLVDDPPEVTYFSLNKPFNPF